MIVLLIVVGGAYLDWICFNLLRLEGVDNPHGEVTDEKERDNLTPGFGALVFRQTHLPALSILDEYHLDDDLHTDGLMW